MTTHEAIKNFREKWCLFMKALREEFSGKAFLDFALAMFFIGASVFCLAIAWAILFGGGFEYAVKIGR